MDIKTLFMLDELPKLAEEDIYVKCFTRTNGDVPLATPAIVNFSHLEKQPEKPKKKVIHDWALGISGSDTTIMFPFSVRNIGRVAGNIWHLSRHDIKISDQPLFLAEHVVKEVDCFNYKKMKTEILELTRGPGLSLIIKGQKNIDKTIAEIKGMNSWFEYNIMNGYNIENIGMLEDPDDEIVCVMTFLNLTDCIPVFNTRKISGFGLSFNLAFEKKLKEGTKRCNLATVDLTFNDHIDNMFEIDGQQILNNDGSAEMNIECFVNDFTKVLNDYKASSLELVKAMKESRKKAKNTDNSGYINVCSTGTASTSAWNTYSSTYDTF